MVTAPPPPPSSNDEDSFGNSGKNFSGSRVMLGSEKIIERACNKNKCRSVDLSKYKQNFFFQVGLHCRKTCIHSSTRVEEFIGRCWQEGGGKIVNGKKVKSHLKVQLKLFSLV